MRQTGLEGTSRKQLQRNLSKFVKKKFDPIVLA